MRANRESEEFLRRKQGVLSQEWQTWMHKYDVDIEEQEKILEQLKARARIGHARYIDHATHGAVHATPHPSPLHTPHAPVSPHSSTRHTHPSPSRRRAARRIW